MAAELNSLNVHIFPIFQQILMILAAKCMVHRVLSDKTYLSLELPSPLTFASRLDPDQARPSVRPSLDPKCSAL